MQKRSLVIVFTILTINIVLGQKAESLDALIKSNCMESVPFIYPQQLAFELQRNPESVILLDAREPKEYEVSHLENAKFVGYKKFSMDSIKNIPKDKKIVVYCSLGVRSEHIGEKLKVEGFDVYNLYGGIFEWVNNDYSIVDDQEKETDKVHAYSKSWGIWLLKGKKIYE